MDQTAERKLPHFSGTDKRKTLPDMFKEVGPKLENIEGLKKTVVKGTPPENRSYAKEREERDAEIIKAQGKELNEQKGVITDLRTEIHDLAEKGVHDTNKIRNQETELLGQDFKIKELQIKIDKLQEQAKEKDKIIAQLQTEINSNKGNEAKKQPEKKPMTNLEFSNELHNALKKFKIEAEGKEEEQLQPLREKTFITLNNLFTGTDKEDEWIKIQKGNFDLLKNDNRFKKEEIANLAGAVTVGTESLDDLIKIANVLLDIEYWDAAERDPKVIVQELETIKKLVETTLSGESSHEKITENRPTVDKSTQVNPVEEALSFITRKHGFRSAATRIMGKKV